MDFLDNIQASFYVASMILAIEYLHSHRIVYRDIKPENIMVNEKGQMRLIDMGTAKVLGIEGEIPRTYTILGTPHYMAPEILLGKGYGLKVDLWSIGVVLFEFMCGMVPFGDDCEEPYDVYQQVISQKLSFPSYFYVPKNKMAAKMMTQLMNRSADGRDRNLFFIKKRWQLWSIEGSPMVRWCRLG
jgi:cGMP-dependent protein kinase